MALPNKPDRPDDPVNHPSHYTAGRIEVIDFIEDQGMGFCDGNAIKYIVRHKRKNHTLEGQIQDLEKAKWYIDRLIKQYQEAK